MIQQSIRGKEKYRTQDSIDIALKEGGRRSSGGEVSRFRLASSTEEVADSDEVMNIKKEREHS